MEGLTDKQIAFCHEYIKDLNASRAARAAGYSDSTAGQYAFELLNGEKYQDVRDYLAGLMKQRSEEAKVDADYVLKKLKMISEARIEDYVKLANVVSTVGRGAKKKEVVTQSIIWKSFDELSEDQKGAIQGISQTKQGINIKLFDKSWSLDMISKHIGLYEKDNKQKDQTGGVAIYLPSNGRDLPKDEPKY